MSGITDTVADYLTRIRNAQKARHRHVDIPASKLKRAMTQIMVEKGYVKRFIDIDDSKQGLIRIYLKYDQAGKPVIHELKRVSRPGLRRYVGANDLPRVKNGLGVAILSTSQGLMTDKEARIVKVGGEVLAYVY
ncbi:MAG: 30S ribosomal protein S8 [Rhodothermales bacterium]